MTAPKRIQLRRARGWRKPEGAIVVSRPSRWGNPFRVYEADGSWWVSGPHAEPIRYGTKRVAQASAVALFEVNLSEADREAIRRELAGADLACWCAEGDPCHGDVELRIANP